MPSAGTLNLSDYKEILTDHEQEYQQCLGLEHQSVLRDIIKEISTQSGGTVSEDTVKGLGKVSQLVQMCNPGVLLS